MAAKSECCVDELRLGAAAEARSDSEELGAHDRGYMSWGGGAAQGKGEGH